MILKNQHHIAVISSDYAKAKEFYIDKLGFELTREFYRPEQKDYLRMLQQGDTCLELFVEWLTNKTVNDIRNRRQCLARKHITMLVLIKLKVLKLKEYLSAYLCYH